MIRFQCKNCGRSVKADDHLAGTKDKCPGCGQDISIPKRATSKPPATAPRSRRSQSTHDGDVIQFPCENCHQPMKAEGRLAGSQDQCPACGHTIVIPRSRTTPKPAILAPVGQQENRPQPDLDTPKPTYDNHADRSAGLVQQVASRLHAHKARKELESLERAINENLIELGKNVIASGVDELPTPEQTRQLDGVTAQIRDGTEQLESLQGTKGTASIARELRQSIKHKEHEYNTLLLAIGRAAYEAGHLEESACKRITNLERMRDDHQQRMAQYSSTSTRPLSSILTLPHFPIRSVLVVLILLFTVAIAFLACSYLIHGSLESRLAGHVEDRLRQQIQDESDGRIRLSAFQCTNSQQAEVMGVPIYRIKYEAEIEYLEDCWTVNPDAFGKGISGVGFFANSPFSTWPADDEDALVIPSNVRKQAKLGDRTSFSDSVLFEETNKGWEDPDGELVE